MIWIICGDQTSHHEEWSHNRLHTKGVIESGRDCLTILRIKLERHV